MAQINTCLKRTFIIFNVLFAILGAIIILLPLLSQVITNVHEGEMEGRTTGLIVLYLVGSVTLILAILGAYGAHKENKVCLIIFLVCMVIGSLMMLRVGVVAAFARPQLASGLSDRFHSLLPLDKSSDEVQSMAETLQTRLHCCGLFSYKDWEDNIPSSCLCNSEQQEEEGMCQNIGYTNIFNRLADQRKSIYSKTCFPIIRDLLLMVIDIVIGVIFTMAALALLGMTLSSIMIHQMRHPSRATVLMVPSIFNNAPPKYQELQNTPNY